MTVSARRGFAVASILIAVVVAIVAGLALFRPGAHGDADAAAGEAVEALPWCGRDGVANLRVALGGTVTGEHGVGQGKRAFLQEEFSACSIVATMCRVSGPSGSVSRNCGR